MKIDVPKVGANLIYDLLWLKRYGVEVTGPFYDVQLAEPLIDENRRRYNLESLAQKYLDDGKQDGPMEEWLQRSMGRNVDVKGNIWRAPPEVAGIYAESDVDLPLRIFEKQEVILREEGLWELYKVEAGLLPMLVAMKARGVPVDVSKAEQLRDRLVGEVKDSMGAIKRLAGVDVNIMAADSLAKAFDAVGHEYPLTATGKPSFQKEWLQNEGGELGALVTAARSAEKFKGTFVEGYILNGNVKGRIHANFNSLRSDSGGTVSGRFSSSHPNLQNIPSHGEMGKLIRSIFVPDPGTKWWALDWSQVEYRIIVHYAALMKFPGAQDAADAYINDPGTDFHEMVGEMAGISRGDAKALNFGLAYGQGLPLLCYNLGVSETEGQRIIGRYHENAPFVKKLSDAAALRATSTGFVTTIMGRRRRFMQWEKRGQLLDYVGNERQPGARRAFTHKSLNAVIQGSAADIMKKAMIDCWDAGVFDVLDVPYLTVHDELDGSMPETKEGREAFEEVRHIMETSTKLLVPLKADGSVGNDWSEAK
jgi:DNA polymerase I-like protein with 3'-5' exonuclease and polymerase domains